MVPHCAFENSHVEEAYLGSIPVSSCSGEYIGDFVFFSVDDATCGTKIEQNETHISYSNYVGTEPEGRDEIVRSPMMKIDFECSILTEVLVDLGQAIHPIASVIQIDLESRSSSFNVTMG